MIWWKNSKGVRENGRRNDYK